MSTPQLHIKLSQPNGSTRMVVFETIPTWDDLAARANAFFDIPADSVALAYVDGDGDEVTLSSQGEFAELLSTLLRDIDSTIATVKFTVRDLRVLREVRTHEDANTGVARDQQPIGPAEGDDHAQGERALPPDNGDECPPFGHEYAYAMHFMPSRGFFSPRGRGGRGSMRGGFARGGPFHSHHGHHGPPGFSPPFRGAFAHGRGRGPPPPTMNRETLRAHSAPPEFCASAPEDDFPAPPQPEEFAEHPPPFPPFDGLLPGPWGMPPPPPLPPHADAHFPHHHFHHHPYMSFEHRGRGGPSARSRGGFGFGHHKFFGHGPHGTFPDFDEHHPFGLEFGGRGRRGRSPGFGHFDPRMGMDMSGFGFDDPRLGMGPGRHMGMGGPRVTVACAGI